MHFKVVCINYAIVCVQKQDMNIFIMVLELLIISIILRAEEANIEYRFCFVF